MVRCFTCLHWGGSREPDAGGVAVENAKSWGDCGRITGDMTGLVMDEARAMLRGGAKRAHLCTRYDFGCMAGEAL